MTTDREYRLYTQDHPVDLNKQGNVRYSDGSPREGIQIDGQKVTIDLGRLYPDDAIAFIRDMYHHINKIYPSQYNKDTIYHLNKAIYSADLRAVANHGYSWSPDERDLKLPSDY